MIDATTMLGVRIDKVEMSQVIEHIGRAVSRGESFYIVTPNPAILMQAQKDSLLHRALNAASLSLPDGMGVLLVSRLSRAGLSGRVTGIDLCIEIAREAAERGWRIGLWSPLSGVGKRASEMLRLAFPGFDGVAIDGNEAASVDVLLVGLGAPQQERWMFESHNCDVKTVMVGVGGSIDLIAGVRPRSPRLLCAVGLEWLWRLLLEPRRHWMRVIRSVIMFPLAVFRYNKKAPRTNV